MRRSWVVLLEVDADAQVEEVKAVLAHLGDRYPSALHAVDRCAVQFLVDADGPDTALVDGLALWRVAARAAGFPDADVVRAEVKTPAELAAEYADVGGPVSVPADERALASAYDATRRLLRSTTPREAMSVLFALVRQLGGTVVPPQPGDPRTIDCDLSLGEGSPSVAAAEPYSVARLDLEEVLPAAVEDARRVVQLLRAAPASGEHEDLFLDLR